MNLIEKITEEIERVTEIRTIYAQIPGGQLAAVMITAAIEKAKTAAGSGDITQMMRAIRELEEFEL
jgi:hypothetical protein